MVANGSQPPTAFVSHAEDTPSFGPNSPEWGQLNSRRSWLIHKKVDSFLSKEEEIEFVSLQQKFSDAVERLFPRRQPSSKALALINQMLKFKTIDT